MKINPITGKQVRGFALMDPHKRHAAQAKGVATIRKKAAPKKLHLKKDELYRLYWKEGLSLSQISAVHEVHPQTVLNRMRKFGVKRRSSVKATALRRLDPEISDIASKARRGKRNPFWNGGRTPLYKILRTSRKMREWRMAVFRQDNYTCQICGQRGGDLHADHLYAFARIIVEDGIKTLEQAEVHARLWNLENGRTLCMKCHKTTDTFDRKGWLRKKSPSDQAGLILKV